MLSFLFSFSDSHSKYPTTESLTLLVVQAVHSGDKRLLEQALIVNNERLVVSTVRKLPVTAVIPFLKIVSDMTYKIFRRCGCKLLLHLEMSALLCCKFKGHMIIVDLSLCYKHL